MPMVMKKNFTGKLVIADTGEKLTAPGLECTFKITSEDSGNKLALYELHLQPKQVGARLHYHKRINETFIVLKGRLTMQIGDTISEVTEGGIVHIPSYVNHSFSNNSENETKLLLIFNPAIGRELFFRELYDKLSSRSSAGLDQLNKTFDTYFPRPEVE
jgi:quercetin dioxygenase-like cupin family protein